MDPNTTLDDLRRLAKSVIGKTQEADARALAETVAALDASLSKGEPLPAAWDRAGLRTGFVQLRQMVSKALESEDILAFDEGLD